MEFQIRFYTEQENDTFVRHEDEFIYVMEGALEVRLFNRSYQLRSEEFMLVNSNHRQTWSMQKDSAVCVLRFDHSLLSAQLGRKLLFFHCVCTGDTDRRFDYIRRLIDQLLSECAVGGEEMNFRKKSLIYDLLDYLVRYFAVDETTEIVSKEDLRLERMLQYIGANYNRGLTLKETADYMYMARSSFSRYFKKATGATFPEYVNELRLHYALEDICYTGNSVTWISEAHGFTNVSAFCRMFREAYGTSPAAYRKSFASPSARKKKTDRKLKSILQKYQYRQAGPVSGARSDSVRIECSVLDAELREDPWTRALNLGFAHELLNAVMQEQVVNAKQDIGFREGRICGIFSEMMMLREGHHPGITNYFYLDAVFDFLVRNRIRPIVSIDNKRKFIMKGIGNVVYEEPVEKPFENMAEFLAVLEDLLHHMIRRYGLKEVSAWSFECWYDNNRGTVAGIGTNYVEAFVQVSRKIREIVPGTSVGGWGISSTEGRHRKLTADIMKRWAQSGCFPDFVSIYLFPYTPRIRDDENWDSLRLINNADHYAREVRNLRQIMDESGLGGIPVHVTEWNTSLSKRNYYNETCGKAALMLQMIAALDVRVERAAYNELSDLSGIYHDSDDYLFGGRGLVSIHGARKPSYYALMFLKQMKPYVIHRDSCSIISRDENGAYTILCFNAKQLRYTYYKRNEGDLSVDETETIFEDQKNLELTFCFDHMENGTYSIREYRVHPGQGSILREWRKIGYGEKLTQEDYAYLRMAAIPERRRRHILVERGRMTLLQTLEYNEIRLIKISK